MSTMIWVWLGAVVVFGVLEALTVRLVSIWFECGAIAALIAAVAGKSMTVQTVLFAVLSAVALVATRPLVKKFIKGPVTCTNADRVIGQEVRVTETIDNNVPSGAVYADGKTWTARSVSGDVISVGERVRVKNISGVKLYVDRIKKKEDLS